ncbi:MAG: patatin family protein [Eubacterium sp.]|nr:patatin family protein [Eubacterium sp.]MBR7072863.1 patatin family protein [Eubacterium sp.]
MYKCGLVLEGGGSRGIYTSGILDAFIEKGVEFPYVIGVSMGACNAASFLGKNSRRQHDIIIDYINDKRYMSFSNLLKKGEYLDSDWLFGELSYDISPLDQEEFEKSKTVLCCVVTNAKTGKPEYLYPKSLRERGCVEVRASCSLPLATKGVEIGGEVYFDGGVSDSIPLERALEDGCKKAVVILTQHKGFVKKPYNENALKAIRKYPLLREALADRHNLYNAQLEYVDMIVQQGRAFVIQPPTELDCSTLEKSTAKLEAIYRLAYRQGLEIAESVKEYVNS